MWCPLGCGSGQFHDGDNDRAGGGGGGGLSIALCLGCKKQYCRRHQVVWHEDHTCTEYDEFLADPEGFLRARDQSPRREAEKQHQRDLDLASQQVRDAEHQFDVLLAGLQRDREEASRRAELERLERERERQAALERARREAEARRKAEEEAERQRQARLLQARKKAEEDATKAAFANRTFSNPVKPCPSCKMLIEKRGGWSDSLLTSRYSFSRSFAVL